MYMVQHCPAILSFLLSNSDLKFVASQLVTYYMTCYQTKNSREEAQALDAVVNTFARHLARRENARLPPGILRPPRTAVSGTGAAALIPAVDQSLPSAAFDPQSTHVIDPNRPYAVGAGTMIAASRAFTSTDAVPAMMAAFCCLGNSTYVMSHKNVTLPLAQGIAYLNNREIQTTVARGGELHAAIIDYVHRPTQLQDVGWYDLRRLYTVQKIGRASRRDRMNGHADDQNDKSDAMDDSESIESKSIDTAAEIDVPVFDESDADGGSNNDDIPSGEWEVKCIKSWIPHDVNDPTAQDQFEVEWVGWTETTIELRSDLTNCALLLREFERLATV
jgi:hypothetical protein